MTDKIVNFDSHVKARAAMARKVIGRMGRPQRHYFVKALKPDALKPYGLKQPPRGPHFFEEAGKAYAKISQVTNEAEAKVLDIIKSRALTFEEASAWTRAALEDCIARRAIQDMAESYIGWIDSKRLSVENNYSLSEGEEEFNLDEERGR